MLLFGRNHLKASTRAECRPSYGVPVGNTTVEMKELFQLNSFLLNNSHLYASAKAIAAEWPIIGVFKNETCVLAFLYVLAFLRALTRSPCSLRFLSSNNGTWSKPYGDAARSRIINTIVSHRVATLNYWISYELIVGQPLYLIIKRDKKGYWRVCPWADVNKSHPTIDDLVYTYEVDGGRSEKTELGHAVHVGFSGNDQLPRDMGMQHGALGVTRSLIERGVLSTIVRKNCKVLAICNVF